MLLPLERMMWVEEVSITPPSGGRVSIPIFEKRRRQFKLSFRVLSSLLLSFKELFVIRSSIQKDYETTIPLMSSIRYESFQEYDLFSSIKKPVEYTYNVIFHSIKELLRTISSLSSIQQIKNVTLIKKVGEL